MTVTPIPARRNSSASRRMGRLAASVFCFLSIMVANQVGAAAPKLDAALDTASVTLGDPFHLRLAVERDDGHKSLVPEPDLSPMVVRNATAPTTKDLGGGRQLDEFIYELRAYTLDVDSVASVEVHVITATGDTLTMLSEVLEIQVESVRAPDEGDDLRAIKPPLRIPGGIPLWLAAILGALLLVALVFLLRKLLRRKPAATQVAVPVPRGPVDYVREFALIGDMGLLERGAVKLFYTQLAGVMWHFLVDHVNIETLDRTTKEIAGDLRTSHLIDPATADRVVAFLQAADLVKFARAEPTMTAAQGAPTEGSDIVGEVAKFHIRRQAKAREEAARQDPMQQSTTSVLTSTTSDERGGE